MLLSNIKFNLNIIVLGYEWETERVKQWKAHDEPKKLNSSTRALLGLGFVCQKTSCVYVNVVFIQFLIV